jgi:hypothetical protein
LKEPVPEWRSRLEKFQKLMQIIEGRVDIRRRLDAILNPDNIQTSTRLTHAEVDFVTDAYWLAKTYPDLFTPLKDFADELMLTKISQEGLGRQEAIQFMGAIETSKLFKSLFAFEPEKRKKRGIKGIFKREAE